MRCVKKPVLYSLVAIAALLAPIQTCTALSIPEYSANDVIYYNPNASDACLPGNGGGAKPGAGSTTDGNANAPIIWNFFKSKGFRDEQVAGIIGNFSVESGLLPNRVQGAGMQTSNTLPASGGYGLAQWDDRKTLLSQHTKPVYDLMQQLEFVMFELNGPEKAAYDAFKNVTTVEEATRVWMLKYERPGVPALAERTATAKLTYDKYKGSGSSSSGDTVSGNTAAGGCHTNGPGGAEAGNLVQTALNYAWPTYSANNIAMKKTYAAAVQKTKDAGKYIGGIRYPGVDCGGFVTRVYQDSGVDPNYGGNGNTTIQEQYINSSGKYVQFKPTSSKDMKPGDIAINADHTYMYVGPDLTGSDDSGKPVKFATVIASASLDERAPMAGHEAPADPAFHWYRLK